MKGRLFGALLPLGAVVALLLGIGGTAAAAHKPTVWESVADPRLDVAERVHRSVEELLHAAGDDLYAESGQNVLLLARKLLDAVDAAHSPDVRVRFDLGHVLHLLKDQGNDALAVEVTTSALQDAPDDASAVDAYFWLAICYARLHEPKKELEAYAEYLRREIDPWGRAMGLANRAEAYMLLGDLPNAIEDYRASLLLRPDEVLSHWGLAVVLDRSGDRARAVSEVRIAVGLDSRDRRLNSSDVFFVPDYDRYWYEGLGAMVRATLSVDPATAALFWETAVVKWKSYLVAAPSDDRWVSLAEAHLEDAKKSLVSARRRAPLHRPRQGHE